MDLINFTNTLPPDNREFEVFEVVWYGGCKRVVCLADNADHLWLYKPRSFKDPIKVDSRLVKKCFVV